MWIFVFLWRSSGLPHIFLWFNTIPRCGREISSTDQYPALRGFWIRVIIDSRLSARKMSPTSVRQNEGLLSRVYKYGLTLFPTTFECPRRNPYWGATIVYANFLSLSSSRRSSILSTTQTQILCLDRRTVDSSARILVWTNCGSESLKRCAKVSPVT